MFQTVLEIRIKVNDRSSHSRTHREGERESQRENKRKAKNTQAGKNAKLFAPKIDEKLPIAWYQGM